MDERTDAEMLRTGPLPDWTARLRALAAGAPDPAHVPALVDLVMSPPYQSTGSQPGWVNIWRALLRVADADAFEPLRPLAGHYSAHIGAATMGRWVDEHLHTLLVYADTLRDLRATAEPSPHGQLTAAVADVRAGRLEQARTALHAAWRTTRAAPVSELIDTLGERHPVAEPAADALTAATTAKKLDAALLECLRMPPNPRIAAALAHLHRQPSVAAPELTPTATRLSAAVLLHGDAALVAVLRSAGDEPSWLADALRDHLSVTSRPLDEPSSAACDTLARLLGVAGRRSRAQAGRQLLDAVYAAPDDDAPRHEYARWLTGQGDPRGEFITLQLTAEQRDLDRVEQAREAALLARHARTWLGPLAPLAVATGIRFRRGFVNGLMVYVRAPELMRAVIGNPIWSTVESLEFDHRLTGCHSKMSVQDGITHPVMRSLRSLGGLFGPTAVQACATHGDRLGEVAVFGPTWVDPHGFGRDLVEALAALPHVTRLRFGSSAGTGRQRDEPTLAETLFTGPLGETVQTFSTYGDFSNRTRGSLVSFFRTNVPSLRTLELRTDHCGSWSHTGWRFELSYDRGALDPTVRAYLTQQRGNEQVMVSTLCSYLHDLGHEGIEYVEAHVPPRVDILRAMAEHLRGRVKRSCPMAELTVGPR
ncbi:hypothetical protein Aca07nite_59690 [Actinoplanes capillaceus]|uniref:Uncharacterized protein n=1 Tax=Actinoplanes campanulatus TaxID=113559 RepID=A0ABQ3WR12_9ACTN|nr:TIGR02996 domain-containing protein [Actinoplanes capillaceus]GID48694.1 hypothetical protein Aca07nite_59690 [Actinoplanes capillaceus]